MKIVKLVGKLTVKRRLHHPEWFFRFRENKTASFAIPTSEKAASGRAKESLRILLRASPDISSGQTFRWTFDQSARRQVSTLPALAVNRLEEFRQSALLRFDRTYREQ